MQVCAAIILDANKVLIAQRPIHKTHPLEWEFPGGKIEKDETHSSCLKREIKEELGVDIEVVLPFFSQLHRYASHSVTLYFYICKLVANATPLIGLEGQQLKWVEINQLANEAMLAGDKIVVEKLMQAHAKFTP